MIYTMMSCYHNEIKHSTQHVYCFSALTSRLIYTRQTNYWQVQQLKYLQRNASFNVLTFEFPRKGKRTKKKHSSPRLTFAIIIEQVSLFFFFFQNKERTVFPLLYICSGY
ncbi:hypothetical protein AAHE18_13G360900 [Arachis hypogaea]